MKNVSRKDALAWAVESITNWPTISDWIYLKANTPHGWSFSSHPGCSLLMLSAVGNYSISMQDWMKAKDIKIPSREDALSWVAENLAEWPVSENTGAPAGWEWVRLVNPNSVTLVADGRMCIQKQDWLQKKNEFNINCENKCSGNGTENQPETSLE